MNHVLTRILESQQVTDGKLTFPLRHPDFPHLAVHLDVTEGAFLQSIIRSVKPRVSLEVGFAYGVSTLYICDALSQLEHAARHIVMDPFQRTQWNGVGLRNVQEAGFSEIVEFHEERSECALPRLLEQGTRIDFALVDGWHTFDQVMVEFYYLNRMLNVGGVIAFDDADRRSVNRVIRHALTYPTYRPYQESVHARPTVAGRLRKALASIPNADNVLRPDFLRKDWDLGISGSCIAIEKVAEDERSSGWDRSF
jgi:predicted O-methyltransferase YrrM